MICPRGVAVYENLSSEYTDVPQLLSTLRKGKFSGTVEVKADNKRGVFFLSGGDTIDATAGTEEEPHTAVGEEATEELLVLCTEPSATLGVYRLSPGEVEFAASTLQSETVFKGLSTDFVRLDKFLKKLLAEKHHGFLEFFVKGDRPAGILSLKDGETDQLLRIPESGGPFFSTRDDIFGFLEDVSKEGTLFTVYRTLAAPPAQAGNGDQVMPVIKKAEEVKPAEGRTGVQTLSLETVKEPFEHEGPENRVPFLLHLKEVFLHVERFVNDHGEKGSFQRAFKRACVEKSELYPFLDPFEGQFDYSDGRIHLDDKVSTSAFSPALGECLNVTLTYLQRELPKTLLPAGLREEIESLFKGCRDVLVKRGIENIVPQAFC